jgi:hypothetical protein
VHDNPNPKTRSVALQVTGKKEPRNFFFFEYVFEKKRVALEINKKKWS